jgi:hypothetical protein
MGTAIPAIKIANHADPLSIGSPNRKTHTRMSINFLSSNLVAAIEVLDDRTLISAGGCTYYLSAIWPNRWVIRAPRFCSFAERSEPISTAGQVIRLGIPLRVPLRR